MKVSFLHIIMNYLSLILFSQASKPVAQFSRKRGRILAQNTTSSLLPHLWNTTAAKINKSEFAWEGDLTFIFAEVALLQLRIQRLNFFCLSISSPGRLQDL